MARSDRSHPDASAGRGGWRRRAVLLLALVLVVAGGAAVYWRLDPDAPELPALVAPGPDSPTSSAADPTPSVLGIEAPEPSGPAPVAEPVEAGDAGSLDPSAVREALRGDLGDPDLGPHVVARVVDLSDGRTLLSSGRGAFTPASTMKLLTAAAALELLGPDHVFETRVVQGPRDQVVLVGGGDPTLAATPRSGPGIFPVRPDLATLAADTAAALPRGSTVRLRYDASLFSGPSASPAWEPDYVPDGVVSPITALWADEGRPASGFGRVEDPAAAAAQVFARALERSGIRVDGRVRPGRAPADQAELATASSAPLDQLVERILETSDNEGAEVLLRHVGLAQSGAASFDGGAAAVAEVLGSLGVPLRGARIHDGSGLSRADRLTADTLLGVLRTAADPSHPELRPVLTGLPVAGATGSLAARFVDGARPGRGLVRAKTGTLTGVSGLAGLATDQTGATMVFVLVADRFAVDDTLAVRAALDGLAADLAACRCSGAP